MWAEEMTPEQRQAYGFVKLSESEMRRTGYKPVLNGWKKVNKRDEVRVWKDGELLCLRKSAAALPGVHVGCSRVPGADPGKED